MHEVHFPLQMVQCVVLAMATPSNRHHVNYYDRVAEESVRPATIVIKNLFLGSFL